MLHLWLSVLIKMKLLRITITLFIILVVSFECLYSLLVTNKMRKKEHGRKFRNYINKLSDAQGKLHILQIFSYSILVFLFIYNLFKSWKECITFYYHGT